jgi:sporulation protein YlmC with PRC-barrel domain
MSNITATANSQNTSLDQITSLITNINSKLRNFSVIDKHGNLIGKVKDIILDSNRQISFIIEETNKQAQICLFILKGQLVQKIDSQAHCLILIVDKSQLEYLPKYFEREHEPETEDKIPENTLGNLTVDNSLQRLSTPDTSPNETTNFAVDSTEQIESEDIIRLLGERLIIDRSKRKVGEVVVRKEIETRMVTVPVRHERLIVEQISPEHKELANIYLGGEELIATDPSSGQKLEYDDLNGALTVSGEFSSPKIASLLLNAIALERNNGCKRVKITIAVEDEQHQQQYQEWFARTSGKRE